MTKKPVGLVDLDGTLADFDGAMRRDLTALLAPGEKPLLDAEDEDKYPHIKARRRLIKKSPNWWYNLERIEQGFKVVQMLRQLEYAITICSRGPKNNASAWEQKVRWCELHVPDAKVTITQDKSTHYGWVLVDDWPDYIQPWLKERPRGLVIMPDRPWNQGFGQLQVVRHHALNDDYVLEMLTRHRNRKLTIHDQP